MQFNFGFYSSLLLIFFVHGLVYSFLLFRKAIKNDTLADKWLGLFLLLCILYIAPWMLGFGGWYDTQPYRDIIFYFPCHQLFFFGPVIFFYVQSLLNPSFKFKKKDVLHLLPGIIYLLYSLVVFVTDKIVLKEYYFLADGVDKDFDEWYQWSGFISMFIYFLLTLRYYKLYKKMIVQVVSYADVVLFKWIKNFLIAFLIILVIKLVFVIAGFSPYFSKYQYIGYWWEYFSIALVFYYIAITGYSNAIETKVPFKINLLQNKSMLLLNNGISKKDDFIEDIEAIEIVEEPSLQKNEDALVAEWKPKIITLLEQDKIYEHEELSLTQMAKLLKTNPSVLSKVINQGFAQNFNDFINSYRIKAVIEKLNAGEQKTQTLLGIAFDCGFNSKATFNRAFKKQTSVSPKEWIEKK